MKNKKIASLLVAGALTVGVVGGTLAWLSASDHVTNNFSTGVAGGEQEQKVGVEIYEKFDKVAANKLLPGTTVDKKVQVKNEATFDQFIRVKVNLSNSLSQKVTMNFADNTTGVQQLADGKWFEYDGYYYYMGKVAPGKFTNNLLESVSFDKSATMDQMNKAFNVDVTAESVQASNGAFKEIFKGIEKSTALTNKFAALEKAEATGNNTHTPGAQATDNK